MKIFQAQAAGYAHLLGKYAVEAPALLHRSQIDDGSTRRLVAVGRGVNETFPERYAPDDTDFDHLVFALKYDGVDLAVLHRLLPRLDRDELVHRISTQPTSKYARRVFFLFEFLTGERLALDDLTRGPYCQVLDPDEYFVAADRQVPRYRVHDNLPGDAGFCPIVRRTPLLVTASGKDLGGRAREITSAVEPLLLTRALSYLYTKETRSSFAIEREEVEPGMRMERFIAQLATAGQRPLDSEAELTELQRTIVDPRYAEHGFRRAGEPEVYIGETVGLHERVHHVGARSASTPELMAAWARMRRVEDGVKSAFFCIGKRIAENEQLFQQLHEEGHLIGNHSFSHHVWFDLFSAKKMLADMRAMDMEMERVTGLQPKLFRPPYGVTNPNLNKAIINGGYTSIGWSVRSMDTVIENEKMLFDKICRSLKPGAIFLFHDTSKTTLAILPAFINWVKQNGYEIVRLDKMLHLKPYA